MARTFRLLLGINVFWLALSLLSDGINTLVLPHQLLVITGNQVSATTLGLITFGGLLVAMLVQPIAGLWSDRTRPRWGRRDVLGWGVLFVLVGLALWAGIGAGALWGLIGGYLIIQVAGSVAQAAQQGLIPDLVSAERRGTASGVKNLMDMSGALSGFVLLGYFLSKGQINMALGVMAAVVLTLFVVTMLVIPRTPSPAILPPRHPWWTAFQLDWHEHRPFIWLVVSRFLFLWGIYAVGRFLLFFIAHRLHLPATDAAGEAGMLLAGLTAITVLAAPPMGWAADRYGRLPLMALGVFLSATGVWLLAIATSTTHIFLFGGVMALGSAAFTGANWASLADLAPPARAATFMGLANFGTAGAAALAGLLGPLIDGANSLADGTGYTALFIVAGLLFISSAAVLYNVKAQPLRLQSAFDQLPVT